MLLKPFLIVSTQEEHLRTVPDVYRLVKKFMRQRANLQVRFTAYSVVTFPFLLASRCLAFTLANVPPIEVKRRERRRVWAMVLKNVGGGTVR